MTLPRLDSNQDKQNQNLLCYRYTTGQEERARGEGPTAADPGGFARDVALVNPASAKGCVTARGYGSQGTSHRSARVTRLIYHPSQLTLSALQGPLDDCPIVGERKQAGYPMGG